MSIYSEIYEAVKRIPKGKVATYGQIAAAVGNPRLSRVAGYALHVNPTPGEIPCHRVVNRFGKTAPAFAFGGEGVQRAMLLEEGVHFNESGCVDLSVYGCDTVLLQAERR